jgi:glycosyltransferase involved in cell wall biosynthesis
VPAYQERRFIERTLRTMPGGVDLIVVVDDGSTDGTADRVRRVVDPRIRLIVHERNRGVGAAIVSGYRCALAEGADILVVMAGDNQMAPEDFDSLVAPVLYGQADYSKGNRLAHHLAHDMPWGRRTAGRWLGLLTASATGLSISDSQCGYTAISAAAARNIPLLDLWPRYGYPNDLLALLAARRLRVVEVPVRPVYRGEASGVRAWHAFIVAYVVFRRWWSDRRRSRVPTTLTQPAAGSIPGD